MEINGFGFRLAGYTYLLEKFALAGMPNWHSSQVFTTGTHYSKIQDGFVEEVFRTQYRPGEKVGDHHRNYCSDIQQVCKIFELARDQDY